MRITELNTIELAVNEIFDYHGMKVRVKDDTNDYTGCAKCFFVGREACRRFECRRNYREDEKSIYFVKA